MPTERRRALRTPLHYPARLTSGDGNDQRDCIVWDLSAIGARLTIDAPESIPQKFILMLANDDDVRWNCQVTWRSQQQVGVAFLGVNKRPH